MNTSLKLFWKSEAFQMCLGFSGVALLLAARFLRSDASFQLPLNIAGWLLAGAGSVLFFMTHKHSTAHFVVLAAVFVLMLALPVGVYLFVHLSNSR